MPIFHTILQLQSINKLLPVGELIVSNYVAVSINNWLQAASATKTFISCLQKFGTQLMKAAKVCHVVKILTGPPPFQKCSDAYVKEVYMSSAQCSMRLKELCPQCSAAVSVRKLCCDCGIQWTPIKGKVQIYKTIYTSTLLATIC